MIRILYIYQLYTICMNQEIKALLEQGEFKKARQLELRLQVQSGERIPRYSGSRPGKMAASHFR